MKKLAFAFLAVLALSGCIAVPVAEPAYVGPPAVVVQPYGYYGYYRYGPRYQHHGGYYRGG